MKKLYLLIITALTISNVAFSQTMEKGTLMFGAGVGPSMNYLGLTGTSTPAIRLTGEKGMFEIGPGVLALGGEIGMFNQTYKSSSYYYHYTASFLSLIFAGRAAYYYNFEELLKTPQFNAYAGSALGIRIVTNDQAYPHFGAFVGANWFLTKKFAGFVEAGYDMSWGTIGFNFIL
ncbi:MAG: hypothetical protein A2046_02375 [Bacteroidetes bacterium GWA2_30_7]|nr:MAG: hypothetical protein A2046_02375 [Bacteroidetes bacterium GWA2_30_7]